MMQGSMRRIKQREGFALVSIIVVLVIVGVLGASAIFISNQDHALARNFDASETAMNAAERGLNLSLKNWDGAAMTNLVVGASVIRVDTFETNVIANTRTTRINSRTYSVVSEAVAGRVAKFRARRRIGSFVRLDRAQMTTPGAITTRGAFQYAGQGVSSGVNQSSPGWNCPVVGDTIAALAEPSFSGYTNNSIIPPTGNPALQTTPLANDSMLYFHQPGLDWNTMVAAADKVFTGNASSIQPSGTATTCTTSSVNNWGEPWRSPASGVINGCIDYYPVIYANPTSGLFQLAGNGRGQGILLVNGDFWVSGGTEFHGLILIRGKIVTSGNGFKLYGAAMAWNQNGQPNSMSGNSAIVFSSCALDKVVSRFNSTTIKTIKHRAWADLY